MNYLKTFEEFREEYLNEFFGFGSKHTPTPAPLKKDFIHDYKKMVWKYTKNAKPTDLSELNSFAKSRGIKLPKEYLDIVKNYNNSSPSHHIFDIPNKMEGCLFRCFLSIRKEDNMNIYEVNDDQFDEKIIPFAMDDFGNYICFNFYKQKPTVVFFNYETNEIYHIQNDFVTFLNNLYKTK